MIPSLLNLAPAVLRLLSPCEGRNTRESAAQPGHRGLARLFGYAGLLASTIALAGTAGAGETQDPPDGARLGFTYHGQLTEAGIPATGLFDFRFTVVDAQGYPSALAIEAPEVNVADGSFAVDLGFGFTDMEATEGSLAVAVRVAGTTEEYTRLLPEQPVLRTYGAALSQGGWFSLVGTATGHEMSDGLYWPTGGWVDHGETVRLFTASDKVGIGTDDPQAKLHVEGDALIHGTLRAGGGSWIFSTPSPNEDMCQVTSGVATFGNFTGPFKNIRVGIGTHNPTARLDVAGRARIRRLPVSTTLTNIVVANNAGHLRKRPLSSLPIGTDSDWDDSTNAPNMFSIPTGNVGIGTSTPAEKLHVNGKVRIDALGPAETERLCISSAGVLSDCKEEGWTVLTLDANWASCGYPGALPPQYFKDSSGIVHLKGCIKRLTPGNGAAFTMPPGYRADAHGALHVAALRSTDGGGRSGWGICFVNHIFSSGVTYVSTSATSMQNQTCDLIGLSWRGEP